jgi:hypothetical protein
LNIFSFPRNIKRKTIAYNFDGIHQARCKIFDEDEAKAETVLLLELTKQTQLEKNLISLVPTYVF